MTWLLLAAACVAVDAPRPRRDTLILGVVFTVTLIFLSVGRVTVVVAALIVGATGMWIVRGIVHDRLNRRRAAAAAAYLGIVAADVRAGAGLAHSLMLAAARLPDSVPADMARQLQVAGLVASRGGRVGSMLADAGLPQLATLVSLGETHGLPLAGLVEQAQARLDLARRHAQATSAALQGPQSTAVVLTCLPLAGIGMGAAMGADPLGFLLGGGLGGILLVVGTALVCGGFVWSRVILTKAAAC